MIFTFDTLAYQARGGRIEGIQAISGALLHVKPIIHVDKRDGKYTTVGKARTIPRPLAAFASHLMTVYGPGQPLWITVMHGKMQEHADTLARQLRDRLTAGKLELLRISRVLGVHTGPGVVGAAVVPIELMAQDC